MAFAIERRHKALHFDLQDPLFVEKLGISTDKPGTSICTIEKPTEFDVPCISTDVSGITTDMPGITTDMPGISTEARYIDLNNPSVEESTEFDILGIYIYIYIYIYDDDISGITTDMPGTSIHR